MTDQNPQQPPSPLEDLARRVGTMGGVAEAEIRRIIAYLNDEVVPGVRKQSFTALRRAGEQLTRLADELEKGPKR
ncbi:MAG: hypothetical protein M1568_02805 [Acidobacteria bacterium]|jgi:hypothetical protein|nr:hypothetical protein [Acidobacteriota bacterium]